MKTTFLLIASNLMSLSLVGLTFYMVAHDKDYWYWPMILGVLCLHSVKSSDQKK